MSAIPAAPTAQPVTTSRPGVLVAAVGVAVVTALAAIVNGVLIATGGKELVKDLLVQAGLPEVSDSDLELFSNLAGYTSTDDFVSTFTTRGYLAAGAGAVLLVFGLLMLKAGKAARILVTISAAFTMIFSLVILGDETTTAMAGLAMLAILGGILAIVFTWLPAIGRYAKAARA